MNKLVTVQGKETWDQKEISNEVGKFYQKLYEKRNVEDCEIADLVKEIPKLSDNAVINIEGKLTLEEAPRALKNMKNNNKY